MSTEVTEKVTAGDEITDVQRARIRIGEPALKRFLSYIEIKSRAECWPWSGCKNKHGYAVLHTTTAKDERGFPLVEMGKRRKLTFKKKIILAHRLAFRLWRGALLDSEILRRVPELCHDRACMNPWHVSEPVPRAIYLAEEGERLRQSNLEIVGHRLACKRGHLIEPSNIYTTNGFKECLACRRLVKWKWHWTKLKIEDTDECFEQCVKILRDLAVQLRIYSNPFDPETVFIAEDKVIKPIESVKMIGGESVYPVTPPYAKGLKGAVPHTMAIKLMESLSSK